MIKNFILALMLVTALVTTITATSLAPTTYAANTNSNGCKTKFFGMPTWYEFLKLDPDTCEIDFSKDKIVENNKVVANPSVKDIWLIILAVIDILSTLAGLLAVIFVAVGGFKFVTSQAVPEKIANAKSTIANALVGLAIAIIASQVVTYLGHVL